MVNAIEATLRSRYVDGISPALKQTEENAKRSFSNLRDAQGRFASAGSGAAEEVQRASQRAMTAVEDGASRALRIQKRVIESFENIAEAARKVVAPISAVFTLGALGAVKLAADMQTAEIGFKSMLGSAEAAKKFLGELQQFAAKTPFEFTGLVQTSNRMLALGFTAKELLPVLRSVGDAAAALGGGQEKIERIIAALGQMRAKGKVSAEELMQLAEAGIPAYDILAKKIGVDIPTAMKLAEKGAIDANAAVMAIVQGLNERFGGRMADMSNTLKGQFSNLIDAIKITGTTIGQTFLPDATKAVQKANEFLEWAKNAAVEFVKLPEPIKNTAYAITLITIAAGPASLAITALTSGIKNLLIIAGPLVTLGTTARTVAFAVSNNLTGALVGAEAALYGVARAIPPVAVGLGVWWAGNKLLEHAQGNKHLDTTAEALKKINDRLRETPQWWIQRGMTPPKTTTDTIIDYLKNLDAQKPRAETKTPPLLRPDPEEIKKQAEKIREEQNKLRDITRELYLRLADDRQAAFVKLEEDYRHINELTKTSVTARNEAKRLADQAYLQTVREINEKEREEELKHQRLLGEMEYHEMQERSKRNLKLMREWYLEPVLAQMEADKKAAEEAVKREEQRQREVSGVLAAAQAIDRAITLSRAGKIDANIGTESLQRVPQILTEIQNKIAQLNQMKILTPEQIAELERLKTAEGQLQTQGLSDWQKKLQPLHEQFKQLNSLGMDPFHQTVNAMQEHIVDFAGQATEAFATFFSALVTGQEGAGRKLLAAFVGMIGQMLVKTGVMLVQVGIAEVALAHTAIGRIFLQANAAAGYKAIATGIAMAAIGGIMMGAADAIAGNTEKASGSSGSSSPQQASTSSSNQVQVISVGAPRGPQSPGQASAQQQQQQPIELRVTVESKDSHIVRVVERNVRNNGSLRTVIQNA